MATRLFGVVGHPMQHTLSPDMHNAAFKKLGLDCKYSAFDIRPDDLGEFLRRCREGNFSGLNVTVPHKIKALKLMDSVDENAKLMGAVNTIRFDGSFLSGHNTDGVGCIKALAEAGEKVGGRRVLVLGAGGAARAAAFQCAKEGSEVALANRTQEKALELAKEIREKLGRRVLVVSWEDASLKAAVPTTDILINATSVGMHPRPNRTPIPAEILQPHLTVMDLVYNPRETLLLRHARRAGCKTIDGVGMLVWQGAESLRIWLNVEPPIEEMREAVMAKLK